MKMVAEQKVLKKRARAEVKAARLAAAQSPRQRLRLAAPKVARSPANDSTVSL